MPLEILALMVVVGVGGIVLAIHLTGGTITATLESGDAARGRFAEDFPEAVARNVLLTANKQTALLELTDNAVGIVHAIGDRFLTRHLKRGDRYSARPEDDATLLLQLDDISWPGDSFRFSSVAERDKALALLTKRVFGGDGDG